MARFSQEMLLLFYCMTAFVTHVVIAAASMLG
jgi:hypothetical protein